MISFQFSGSPLSGQLGDFRNDLTNALAIVLGRDKAVRTVNDFEATIRQKAAEGTSAAIDAKIPEIRMQVQSEAGKLVRPLFIGAAAIGGVGVVLGLIAAGVAKKRCPKR